jgi:hypothetical protein
VDGKYIYFSSGLHTDKLDESFFIMKAPPCPEGSKWVGAFHSHPNDSQLSGDITNNVKDIGVAKKYNIVMGATRNTNSELKSKPDYRTDIYNATNGDRVTTYPERN